MCCICVFNISTNYISSSCPRRVTWHMKTTCGWQEKSSVSWELLPSCSWRWIYEPCFIYTSHTHFTYILYAVSQCIAYTHPAVSYSNRSLTYWEWEQGVTLARQHWEAPSMSSCEYKHFWAVELKHTCCEIPSNLSAVCVVFDQHQLRLPGGAAVRVQSLWGAGRSRGNGSVFSSGLVQRHVLRPGVWNARPLCHHDTEGRRQLSLDADAAIHAIGSHE